MANNFGVNGVGRGNFRWHIARASWSPWILYALLLFPGLVVVPIVFSQVDGSQEGPRFQAVLGERQIFSAEHLLNHSDLELKSNAERPTTLETAEFKRPIETYRVEQDPKPRRLDIKELTRIAQTLQEKHGPAGFHVVVCEPFVVIGDETLSEVGARADQTVRWAVDRLRDRYFPDDPQEVVTIWLFRDRDSYEKNCQAILGITPHTPYGFYSAAQQVLVMNISTGGGTLVHEIVHPFMAANFPQCPAWFNEGLASLYEQSAQRQQIIWGLTNWRLRGLQLAVEQNRVPSFEELTRTTTRDFYERDSGTNYAQARYLCYYLQQQGQLQTFYREFKQNVGDDPTGYKTLTRILAITDWPKFESEWREFVMGLKFPEAN